MRPSGTVTFLFTDIEGSTRLWEDDPDAMGAALSRHDDILRDAISAHDGWLFKHTGDGVVAAFGSASAALAAAALAQGGLRLPVRMGIATGETSERDDDYFGPVLNRAARIMAAGHGGQVLVAASTVSLVDDADLIDLIEAPESGNFRALLAHRLRRILFEYDRDRDRKSASVLRALRVLKAFSLQLPDGASVSVDVDALAGFADSGVLAEDLTDLLVAAGEAAAERGSGVLLVIDDVQYLKGDELAALITAIHRTTQRDLPVVLVGAGLPQLPGLAGDAKSYAERLFEFPPIGSLERSDAAAALQIPVQVLDVEYSDEALEIIILQAQGYPYFLQEWGYHTWNRSRARLIDGGLVEAVSPEVVRHLDENFFFVRFDRLTPAEKRYLRAMAALGSGPHRSGDIAAELNVRVESVAPRRSGLISKGMIYSPAHGDTAFTVPLFDQFLKRVMP